MQDRTNHQMNELRQDIIITSTNCWKTKWMTRIELIKDQVDDQADAQIKALRRATDARIKALRNNPKATERVCRTQRPI